MHHSGTQAGCEYYVIFLGPKVVQKASTDLVKIIGEDISVDPSADAAGVVRAFRTAFGPSVPHLTGFKNHVNRKKFPCLGSTEDTGGLGLRMIDDPGWVFDPSSEECDLASGIVLKPRFIEVEDM